MFHLQQTHFGETKLLKIFFINNSVDGKIQFHYQYVEKKFSGIISEGYEKYPTIPKLADI